MFSRRLAAYLAGFSFWAIVFLYVHQRMLAHHEPLRPETFPKIPPDPIFGAVAHSRLETDQPLDDGSRTSADGLAMDVSENQFLFAYVAANINHSEFSAEELERLGQFELSLRLKSPDSSRLSDADLAKVAQAEYTMLRWEGKDPDMAHVAMIVRDLGNRAQEYLSSKNKAGPAPFD